MASGTTQSHEMISLFGVVSAMWGSAGTQVTPGLQFWAACGVQGTGEGGALEQRAVKPGNYMTL